MCGKTRIYFFKRRVHRVEAYRTHRFFHSPEIAASGALWASALSPRFYCLAPAPRPTPQLPPPCGAVGIHTCLGTLIPLLFPFILLACLCTNSRAAQVLFRPLSPVMRHVFRLPACAAPAVLLELTAGYPYRREDHRKFIRGRKPGMNMPGAAAMLPAPAMLAGRLYAQFIIASDRIGLNLFFACALAPLLLDSTLSRFCRKPEKVLKSPESAPGGIVSAVQDGIKATVSFAGSSSVFSCFWAVLHDAGIFQFLCGFLSRFGYTVPLSGALLTMGLEITAGVTQCIYWHLPVYFLAFGLGFSGVCIHLQIFSFFHKAGLPLSKTRYVLAIGLFKRTAFRCILFAASLFSPGNTRCRGNPCPQHRAHGGQRGIILGAHRAVCVLFFTCILRSGKHCRKFVVEIPPRKCYNENNSKST